MTPDDYKDAALEVVAAFNRHMQERAQKLENLVKRNQKIIEKYAITTTLEIGQFQRNFPQLVESYLARKNQEAPESQGNVVKLRQGGRGE